MIWIGPCRRFDWSKTHVLSEYETEKAWFIVFRHMSRLLHSGKTFRTFEKTREM